MKMLRMAAAVALGLSAAMAACAPAHAGVQLVTNGGFEQTNFSGSYEINSNVSSRTVTGWTSSGYNFLFTPGAADTSGASGQSGRLSLWGPNNGSANGLSAVSPVGGNFVGADGAYKVGAISQTLNGLEIGKAYAVSFLWAGAQQFGFTGATTELWRVSLGGQTQSTPVVRNVSHGFTGWRKQTFRYIATSTSEVLSFLAAGTPNGEPPFSLLDGVSATAVPEPRSWGVLIMGLSAIGAAVSLRQRTRLRRAA